MSSWTIEQIAEACLASWSLQTCDPVDTTQIGWL
jgi:hypothetical protein